VLAALALIAVFVVGAVFVLAVGRSHGPSSTIVYRVGPIAGHTITDSDLTTTVAILNQRLVLDGVDGSAQKQPPDMVSMQVTGVSDLSEFASRIGAVGMLEFVLLPRQTYGDVTTAGPQQVPADGSLMDPSMPAQFSGRDLDLGSISSAQDPVQPSYWVVNFKFAGQHATDFAAWTAQHVNEYFAIVVDGVVKSVPYIKSAISGGAGEISGDFTEAQARDLAAILGAGALPFPLMPVSTQPAATA
jgi:preprotein translocase subunit SecD